MPDYQYSYAALLVQGCCTFGARGLHFYRHYYPKVFTVDFMAVAEPRFFCNTILNSIIGFPSGRRTLFLNRRSRQFFILHSSFFIQIGFPSGRRMLFLHSIFYQNSSSGYWRFSSSIFSCVRCMKIWCSSLSGLKGLWLRAAFIGRHFSRKAFVSLEK